MTTPFDVVVRAAFCVQCGCKENEACAGGCGWLALDEELGIGVCSGCAPDELTAAALLEHFVVRWGL